MPDVEVQTTALAYGQRQQQCNPMQFTTLLREAFNELHPKHRAAAATTTSQMQRVPTDYGLNLFTVIRLKNGFRNEAAPQANDDGPSLRSPAQRAHLSERPRSQSGQHQAATNYAS